MTKGYFQYYETFEQVVQKFDTIDAQSEFRNKIINYGLYGVEPEQLTPQENFVWDVVKDMIDDQKHRREVNRANRTKKTEAKGIEQPAPEPAAEPEPQQEEKPVEETKQQEKKEPKRFVKPTVEQVQEYCVERKNGLNAQQFIDYYEARGWKIGNNSMKDWKAAVRTWEQRRQTPQYTGTYGSPGRYEWPADKLTL